MARRWKSFRDVPRPLRDGLHAVEHVGHLVEPHRPAVAVRDHNLPEFVGVVELPLGHDAVGGLRPEQLSRGLRHVPVLQRRVDLVDPDLLRLQLVGIDLDAHGVLGRALHVDLRHAGHHRDARRQHVLRVFVHLRHVEGVRRQVDLQDRLVGRVLLAERRRRRQRRRQQRHRRGDGGLHVGDRAVDVAVQVERQRDVGAARAAARRHLVDAGNRRELPFERAGDRRRHRDRIAARQIGASR